ncbi:MAG: hypothetical protein E5Y73_01935 [Mesorhizobium sp.]|uniref:hypothetical protein n=1 Tax=Mesorhizobium sp. TaxID=1871066 RepID=UPI00121940C2|nr:hypothetical protein [Mesorhizobium sp.]TIL96292.1 MAG: hypothetical protein E5Y73_01935 [Mesorhizobium sp.]
MKSSAAALLLFALNGSDPVEATEFQNSYLRFDLPAGWACDTEETEFVCDPPHVQGQPVSAVMILTAKVPGPGDGLADYKQFLETRAAALGQGAMIKAPANIQIGDAIWVDGTLKGSEIPSYRTRYLATVKNGIAILFTFSAHESVYSDLEGAAVLSVSTLKVLDDWKR